MCLPHLSLLSGGISGSKVGLLVDGKAPKCCACPPTPCSSVSKMCPQFACAFVQEAASSSYVWDGRVWWCAVPRFYLWEPVQNLTWLTSRLAPLWLQACQFLRQKVSGLHAGLPFCVQEDTVWREFALRGDCNWSAPTHAISKMGILMWGVT